LETILEYAQTLNKATGIIATSRLTHATPACFMTHVDDRNNEVEIARQIVEVANVDVILGGGMSYFSGAQLTTMESKGYSIVYNRTELAAMTTGRIFGLFSQDHMDYEYDRDYSEQPSIAEMTNKSLEILSQDTDGFFLMVEGSKIDHAAHAWDKTRTALDTIAFDKAIDVAIDYVEAHVNTILIVTADHETGGLGIVSNNLNSELPADLLSEGEKRNLRADRVSNITVSWTTGSHTSSNVPLFAFGEPFLNLAEDVTIHNTEIFDLMKDHLDGLPLSVTPISTTTTTTATPTTSPTPTPLPGDSSLIVIASVTAVALVVVVAILMKKR
ncbi:MAG: alkaline phosphatase, partial [Candidatus Thorarchaeota archaeon]